MMRDVPGTKLGAAMTRFLVTILLLTLPCAAHAQESEDDSETYVETRARDVVDPRAPTGFAADVDLRDLELAGEDLGDALDRIPGVFVLRQSSYGQSAYASVRGGNPRQLPVSVAGVELSIPAGLGFDVGSASVGGLTRARVFRGAAGVHRGAGALTGAVELTPTWRKEAGNRLTASALGGSHGTVATGVAADVGADWASLGLGAEVRRSQGDFTFEDGNDELTRINNDHERQAAYGNARIEITNQDELLTVFRYEQGERGTPGPAEFQDALAGARSQDARGLAIARFNHRNVISNSNFGSLDLYESFGAQWRRESYRNDSTLLGAGEFASESDYVAASVQAGFLHYMKYENANSLRFDFAFKSEGFESRERGVFTSNIDTSRQTTSLSLSDEFLKDDDTSLILGIRYESLEGEREESAWIPFAGAMYQLYEELELRANVAHTYRPPDFDELYLSSEILRGDPGLRSERASTFDIGARARFERVWAELTFFANRITDPIRFLPVDVYVTQAQNLEDYNAFGSEASVEAVLHARWFASAAYTYTYARLTEVDAQAPAVPEHAGVVATHFELAGWVPWVERLQVGTEARVRGEMNLDIFGNVESPAWVDLGAHVLVSPLKWLDARISAQNLLDRRDVTDALQQPLPGRTFFLGISMTTEEP